MSLQITHNEQRQITKRHGVAQEKERQVLYRQRHRSSRQCIVCMTTQMDFGYNVSVAAIDSVIRETRVNTGSQPDPMANYRSTHRSAGVPRPDAG